MGSIIRRLMVAPHFTSSTKMNDKKFIRDRIIIQRNGLLPELRERASFKIAKFINYTDLSLNCSFIAGYAPLGSEADPRPVMEKFAQSGMGLCLPYTHKSCLTYHKYNFGNRLVRSGFGTEAPDPNSQNIRPDILLVPLVAFDITGARIGWGKGYYDRSISELKADGKPLLTIGIAFSFQQVNFVPVESHDVTLDYVATEQGLIVCHKS